MACELFSFATECDIPNWLTMIIELILGGIVATLFFVRQQKQSKKLEQIAKNNEITQFERHSWSEDKLKDNLNRIKELTEYQIEVIEEYYRQIKIGNTKSKLEPTIGVYDDLIKGTVDALDAVLEQSIGLVTPQIIHDCKTISRFSKQKRHYFDPSYTTVIILDLKTRISKIESILQNLTNVYK